MHTTRDSASPTAAELVAALHTAFVRISNLEGLHTHLELADASPVDVLLSVAEQGRREGIRLRAPVRSRILLSAWRWHARRVLAGAGWEPGQIRRLLANVAPAPAGSCFR